MEPIIMARTTAQMYRLNVFADSSKRFWWRSRRWPTARSCTRGGAPPITGLFAIAFEITNRHDPCRYRCEENGSRSSTVGFENVVRVPDSDKACDLVLRKASAALSCMSFVPHNDTVQSVVQKRRSQARGQRATSCTASLCNRDDSQGGSNRSQRK